MVKPRVVETNEGIQGELDVQIFNKMQRRHRDKGWLETGALIKNGIDHGLALEIGPGPGYLGLEWLKNTTDTELRGQEISKNMIKVAEANAKEYGLQKRAKYVIGDAQKLEFDDNTFDAVFSTGSLHEWANAEKVFNEIHRVLKPGGRYFIGDLRRNISAITKQFLYKNAEPKEILPGFKTSLNAAYTPKEAEELIGRTKLRNGKVTKDFMGIKIAGKKE